MKKLNRKGFTLIELLAVIVIMAIIVVVTVPTIINTIADARVNSLWNLAKTAANTYDNLVAQDMLSSNKVLDGIELSTEWMQLSVMNEDNIYPLEFLQGEYFFIKLLQNIHFFYILSFARLLFLSEESMKIGLIDLGGGMRGTYATGVLEYCTKNNS